MANGFVFLTTQTLFSVRIGGFSGWWAEKSNQRINGLVNAHLISGPSTKPG